MTISQRRAALIDGYLSDAERIIAAKMAAAVRGLKEQPESGKHPFMQARLRVLQSDIERIKEQVKRRSAGVMDEAVGESAREGAGGAERQVAALRRAKPDLTAAFAGIDQRAVEVIARDSAARMGLVIDQHGERALSVFRSLSADATRMGRLSEPAVNEAVARGLILGDPRATQRAVRELFREEGEAESADALEYRRLGDRQVVVGGWTGSLRGYSNMVAVTRTREATEASRRERLLDLGVGTVQITGRRSLNFCTRFLGLVCAYTVEASEGGRYPLLASLPGGGPPFHPRCSKSSAPYIADLVSDRRAAEADKAQEVYVRARNDGTLARPIGAPPRRAA